MSDAKLTKRLQELASTLEGALALQQALLGAQLLEQCLPRWYAAWRLNDYDSEEHHLCMSSSKDDVLGRLFGSFLAAQQELGFTDIEAVDYGFLIFADDYPKVKPFCCFEDLTEAWCIVIALRRQTQAAQPV